jgi:hypothetical protein
MARTATTQVAERTTDAPNQIDFFPLPLIGGTAKVRPLRRRKNASKAMAPSLV